MIMVDPDGTSSPYYIPTSSDDIDWTLLKKALFQGIQEMGETDG